MNELGHFAMWVAWGLSLAGMCTGFYAGRKRSAQWFETTVRATILVAVASGIAFFTLGYLFLADDYTNQYVWQFSNRTMPEIYKFTAIWGGMDGSMLLWCFFLAVCGAAVALKSHSGPRVLMPWVLGVCNSSSLFFLSITAWVTNPFRHIRAPFIPPDGNGLNPLLQDPFMAIHPPMLYAGFTGFSVPFAFCIGALLSGYLSNEWLRLTRRWTLVAWGFLTIGIVLGGHWAYAVLGWGGFWAWDPVENASFLPWLTGSAYLHSVMVQERKDMLKGWNVWLIISTYMLTVFGTFLTRSGVVQSVHAFASTDVGWVFLVYLGIIFVVAVGLTVLRKQELSSERKIESYLSREAAFLLNNLVFLAICFATLWGVMFPVLSEAITGQKQTVGIPFFNAINVPLFLFLIFLMGVGPLIAWRKASFASIGRTFILPSITAAALGCLLLWAGVEGFYPILSYSLCWFVFMTIMGEFHRGVRAQRLAGGGAGAVVGGVSTLFRRHRDRYAGYLVHLGVLVMTIGITASMAHKVERDFSLTTGESYDVGRFKLTLTSLDSEPLPNYDRFYAAVAVQDKATGKFIAEMHPELRHYRRNNETTSEIDLRTSAREDVYLVLVGTEGNRASLKLFINPLQVWLWIGSLIMVLGTIVIILPSRRSAAETVAGRTQVLSEA
jgi:cytochrome c-type biogenesis protein CcmF